MKAIKTMKQTFEELFLTIVEDGGQVTVGDKTFNVTLAEAVNDEIKPELRLNVPENVEFVMDNGYIALRYNGLILNPYAQGINFALSNTQGVGDRPKSPLQLVPCKLSEVQNGEWVVNKEHKHKSFYYRLKTEIGWVSFNASEEVPIIIQSELSDSVGWLKVVQG